MIMTVRRFLFLQNQLDFFPMDIVVPNPKKTVRRKSAKKPNALFEGGGLNRYHPGFCENIWNMLKLHKPGSFEKKNYTREKTNGWHLKIDPIPSMYGIFYLRLVDFYGKCRQIYHTWMLWGYCTWKPRDFELGKMSILFWSSRRGIFGGLCFRQISSCFSLFSSKQKNLVQIRS